MVELCQCAEVAFIVLADGERVRADGGSGFLSMSVPII